MEAHAHAVLDAAWEAGVRYFDAARSYGRAEKFLSSWLRSRCIDPAKVVVGSKWGYTYTAGWQVEADKHEVKEHTLPVLRRQMKESREFLGDYLKLYQIHSATLESGVLENQDVLEELAALRDGGLVVGLTTSGLRQAETLRQAMAVRIGGEPLFGSVQATWNLLSREVTDALREAHAAGIGVIVKEALANGRLTPRNDDPGFAAHRRLLEEVAVEAGVAIDALAFAAVMAQPWADVVLSGAAQVDHLLDNLQALEVVWDDKFDERLAELTETAEEYWDARSKLEWN
jgi:aryl-alcohol dehydrogenase-like predicted oxidoreductase